MTTYVLGFDELDGKQVALAGGKGASLAELSRLDGVRVPPGFCVTMIAFERIVIGAAPAIDRLTQLKPDDREAIRTLSAEIRRAIEAIAIPPDIAAEITRRLEPMPYAVRSSATAEDLPTASFAGQQDSYLDVVGPAAVLRHISRCWASLFTERAVTYRMRNGFDHRKVHMAVVVQQMVFPQAAGVLFTAEPITSNRKVATVEATSGLGEALVLGRVNPDVYRVRDGRVVLKAVRAELALTDAQVVELVQLGRRIEAHLGRPQDIEWCLAGGDFHIVQSRPITTLFPIPPASDGENHVYISVGHQQMMTDAIKPLGLSFWQLTIARPMAEAGGRLFVDATRQLGSAASRAGFLDLVGKSDPLTRDALQTIIDRGDFVPAFSGEAPPAPGVAPATIETDPAIVTDLIARSEASLAAAKRDIATKSGTALFDFILADLQELRRVQFEPRSMQVIVAGMQASWWLNEQLQQWLGEKNAADALTLSVPNNVTSQMGLALLDVADVIRPHAHVVAFLERVEDDRFLDALPEPAVRDAIVGWLDRYGMRCPGEIDITRPRWSERPSMLVPMLLGNVKNFEPGAGKRRFEQGQQEAAKKEADVLARLRALPDGERKADETKKMIDRVRTFAGYREYPKYGMVSRYFIYKQALMREAARLALRDPEDIFFLGFEELRDAVRTSRVDEALIRERKDAFRSYEALQPPRVLTSEGEALSGSYRRSDLPAGALVGLPVSAGIVEGRARVIEDPSDAVLERGDILVTVFTDPSWTPLFVSITGLVTEVGGLMTHGAVIAREYGLPAVVGVEQATQRIRDGQRIRVNGTEGSVEILS